MCVTRSKRVHMQSCQIVITNMKKSLYLAAIPSFGACHRILPGILCGALLSLPACKPANN
jgi:hypothetical protein